MSDHSYNHPVADTVSEAQFRVEELAARADVGVDTVRYYQAQGLLDRPQRHGRLAMYGDAHLARLGEIRSLADRGFTLAQIGQLDGPSVDPVLAHLVARTATDPALDDAELARRSGLHPTLVRSVADLGLLGSDTDGDNRSHPPDSVGVLTAIARVIDAGVPVEQLGELAVRHAQHVEQLVDDIIELYRVHRRATDREGLADDVDELVPLVAAMVGAHFESVLVSRALRQIDEDGEGRP